MCVCVCVCVKEREETAIATIVIRGATENIMDDIERAVDDGVNTFKALSRVSSSPPNFHNLSIDL